MDVVNNSFETNKTILIRALLSNKASVAHKAASTQQKTDDLQL